MGNYRESRNLESSTIEEVERILDENNYTKVDVVKTFKQAYSINLDPKEKNAIICIRIGNTIHNGAEIGSTTTRRKPLIIIDIFGTSQGQVLDLKDLLIAKLKDGWDYVEYKTTGGITTDATVDARVTNGKIVVESISDTQVILAEDLASLAVHDRYRWRITLNTSKTLLEA
jgi:hypothetical protein